MLIPVGLFSQRISLVRTLRCIPIGEQRRDNQLQTTLIQNLVTILGDCVPLQDVRHGPCHLDQDLGIARTWGQDGWADHSGEGTYAGDWPHLYQA